MWTNWLCQFNFPWCCNWTCCSYKDNQDKTEKTPISEDRLQGQLAHTSNLSFPAQTPPPPTPAIQSLVCCCSSRRITAQHELPKDGHGNKFSRGNHHIKPWWGSRGLLFFTNALHFLGNSQWEHAGEGTSVRLCPSLLSGMCLLMMEKDYSFFRKKMPLVAAWMCTGSWVG